MRSMLKWSPMLAMVTFLAACNSVPTTNPEIIKDKPVISIKYNGSFYKDGDTLFTPANPTLLASAVPAGDAKITSFTYQLDGGAAVPIKSNTPFVVPVTATSEHQVVFSAKDSAGQTSDPVTLKLEVDATPASFNVTSPTANQVVDGVAADFTFSATDADSGVQGLQVVDPSGKVLCEQPYAAKTTATLSCAVDTTQYVDGARIFTLVAVNGVGESVSKSVTVVVKNNPEIIPPTVKINKIENFSAADAAGKTFSGTLQVYVDAQDTKGIKNVQLLVNGNPTPAKTIAPFVFSVDTTEYDNGPLEISALATNNLGVTAQADKVDVKVDNVVPPLISIASPTNGEEVTGQKQVKLLITKRNSNFDVIGDQIKVDVYDFRGAIVASKLVNAIKDSQNGTYTTDPVDFSAFISDFYDIRASANVNVLNADGSVSSTQTLSSLVRVTSKVDTLRPPSVVILSPWRINDAQTILPQYTNGLGGRVVVQFSDDKELAAAELRMTCNNCGPDGPVNALMDQVNLKTFASTTRILDFALNGTPFLPNGNYTLRIVATDNENKSNVQELKVAINRNIVNPFSATLEPKPSDLSKYEPASATYNLTGTLNLVADHMYMALYYLYDADGVLHIYQSSTTGANLQKSLSIGFNKEGTWTFGGELEDLTAHEIYSLPELSVFVQKKE